MKSINDINQLVNQSVYQSLNQSINYSIEQWVDINYTKDIFGSQNVRLISNTQLREIFRVSESRWNLYSEIYIQNITIIILHEQKLF